MDELIKYAKKMALQKPPRKIKITQPPIHNLHPIPEVNIVFNMCNEPSFKYSCANICDKGSDVKQWTSYKLKTMVLYLETQAERFEIARVETQSQNEYNDFFKEFDNYRVARLKEPQNYDNEFFEKNSKPLESKYLEIIANDIDWTEIEWGSDTVKVKDQMISGIRSYKYYYRS